MVSPLVSASEQCDELGILLYEDMGCRPIHDKNNTCPSHFDCLGLKKSNNNCYFKGKAYKIGQQVDARLTSPSCNLGCFCEKKDDTSRFKCAILDCPEWFGANPKPDCYRKYSLGSCCAVRQLCRKLYYCYHPFFNATTGRHS
ncbi:hypothetical protein NQ317_011586 [Molorchus minor]|uniref:VWFC domain-containing protein n=1 Tax=Molorchus minor TaxID=1323400 RepID=A0ABQ9J3N4_9CUCU|nr:hypothetical protein NQ317_011586 [Molorchus minor]